VMTMGWRTYSKFVLYKWGLNSYQSSVGNIYIQTR
jgi:hypothetical protein